MLELLQANEMTGGHYVEPYAGGAGIAIDLLIGGHVKKIHLNDSSYPIFCFWKSIVKHNEEFCRRIVNAALTIEEWKNQREIIRNPEQASELDVGFAAFYLNRCNRSGVLTGGVIGSLRQVGKWKIDARFPRNELIRRVEAIGDRASAINLRNMDAEVFIASYVTKLPKKTLIYCDPPYFERSSRLYLDCYAKSDHRRVADAIQNDISQMWVVSYDAAPQILRYYAKRRKFKYNLQYAASSSYIGREVFIFSDDLVVPRKSTLPYIDVSLKRTPRLFRTGLGQLRRAA